MCQKHSLKKIEKLISSIPDKRDSRLALKFFEKRDFRSILELVESDIYLIEKNIPNSDIYFPEVDYDNLIELKDELDKYLLLIEVPETNEFEDLNYYDQII